MSVTVVRNINRVLVTRNTSTVSVGAPGPQGPPGSDGAGAVSSVNGHTGDVTLDAADVGAATTAYVDAGDSAVASAASSALSLGLAGKQPLDTDLTDIARLSPSNDDFVQRKAGAWANRTVAQVKSDLGLSGTNSGDQTITLTGAVTGSGTGSFATTLASGVDAAKIADGSVSNAEFQRLDGVTSAIQTQIDGKAASSHTHAISDVTGLQAAIDAKTTEAVSLAGLAMRA